MVNMKLKCPKLRNKVLLPCKCFFGGRVGKLLRATNHLCIGIYVFFFYLCMGVGAASVRHCVEVYLPPCIGDSGSGLCGRCVSC